jgi:hypothetical protein
MTVARWTQDRPGRDIAALAPLAASGCIILALTVAGPRVNAAFGSLGLVPLLIAPPATEGEAKLQASKSASPNAAPSFGFPFCSGGDGVISKIFLQRRSAPVVEGV